MSIILTILGIGLVLFIIAAVIIIFLLKKGARFLGNMGGHRHRRFSSSDYRHHGHQSYGHRHYHRRNSSGSGFFSS